MATYWWWIALAIVALMWRSQGMKFTPLILMTSALTVAIPFTPDSAIFNANNAVLLVGLLWLAFWAAGRVDARHAARKALCARADEQHQQVLAGDDRSIYGE